MNKMADENTAYTWKQRAYGAVAGAIMTGLVMYASCGRVKPTVLVSVDGKQVAGLEAIAQVGSQKITVKQDPNGAKGYAVAIDAYKAPAASATSTPAGGKKGGKSGKGKPAKPTATAGDDDLPDAVPEGQAPPQ
jgi:hypothetical protein